MNKSVKPQTKNVHRDLNLGVVIIFMIVTLIFLLSLTQTNYGKELLNHTIELKK